jgi:hypothetical protein
MEDWATIIDNFTSNVRKGEKWVPKEKIMVR